jgi:hypothetical protein
MLRAVELVLLHADPLISPLPKALPLHAKLMGPIMAGPPNPLSELLAKVREVA